MTQPSFLFEMAEIVNQRRTEDLLVYVNVGAVGGQRAERAATAADELVRLKKRPRP